MILSSPPAQREISEEREVSLFMKVENDLEEDAESSDDSQIDEDIVTVTIDAEIIDEDFLVSEYTVVRLFIRCIIFPC